MKATSLRPNLAVLLPKFALPPAAFQSVPQVVQTVPPRRTLAPGPAPPREATDAISNAAPQTKKPGKGSPTLTFPFGTDSLAWEKVEVEYVEPWKPTTFNQLTTSIKKAARHIANELPITSADDRASSGPATDRSMADFVFASIMLPINTNLYLFDKYRHVSNSQRPNAISLFEHVKTTPTMLDKLRESMNDFTHVWKEAFMIKTHAGLTGMMVVLVKPDMERLVLTFDDSE